MDSHDQPTVEHTLYNEPTSQLSHSMPASPQQRPGGPPPFQGPAGPPPPVAQASTRKRPRTGLIATGTFFLGFLVATLIVVIAAVVFLNSQPDRPPLKVPPSTKDQTIIAQVSANYVSQVVKNKAQNSGLPGTVSNLQVTLQQGDQMTIEGDDTLTVAIFTTTKHFTLQVQLYADSCEMKVHVLHVDLAGIPGSDAFAGLFEDNMNRQTQLKSPNLPDGFTYCMTNVRTQPDALFVTYTATPTS